MHQLAMTMTTCRDGDTMRTCEMHYATVWYPEPAHRHGGGRLHAHAAAVVHPLAQRLRKAAAAQRLRLLRTHAAEMLDLMSYATRHVSQQTGMKRMDSKMCTVLYQEQLRFPDQQIN